MVRDAIHQNMEGGRLRVVLDARTAAYRREWAKLIEVFKDVEPAKRELVSGLIEDAAFLAGANEELRQSLQLTGMVKVRPGHPDQQKPIEAAHQYLRNVAAYAVVIKALNSVLSKDLPEGDDGLDDFK